MIIAVDGPAASGKGPIARASPRISAGPRWHGCSIARPKNLLEMGGDRKGFAAARATDLRQMLRRSPN